MEDEKIRVHNADFCKQHSYCPCCARRASSLRRKRFEDAIKKQAEMCGDDTPEDKRRYAYFVTFTVKDGDNLGERHFHLKDAMLNFRKMGQRSTSKAGKVRQSRGQWSKVTAAVGTHETKRGSGSGQYHAHCHLLVFTSTPFDYTVYDQAKKKDLGQRFGKSIPADLLAAIAKKHVVFDGRTVAVSTISEEWFTASGDSTSIDVRPLHRIPRGCSSPDYQRYSKMSLAESIFEQSAEVMKYVSKVDTGDGDFTLAMIDQTHNARFFEAFREFRKIDREDDFEETEAKERELQNYQLYRMSWHHKQGKYSDSILTEGNKVAGYADYSGPWSENDRSNKVREIVKDMGRLVGKYRRDRKDMLASKTIAWENMAGSLDGLRFVLREDVRALWDGMAGRQTSDLVGGSRVRIVTSTERIQSYQTMKFVDYVKTTPLADRDMNRERNRAFLDAVLYRVFYTPSTKAKLQADW
jgi:hypothetical protein